VIAPVRAKKVVSRPRSPDEEKSHGGTYLALYFIAPAILTGGVAVYTLLAHILFGAGTIGLVVFFITAFLAVGFTLVSIFEAARLWRRKGVQG